MHVDELRAGSGWLRKVLRPPFASALRVKTRLEPADNPAGFNTGKIKQQIAAATALAGKVTGVDAVPAPNPALPKQH
jgi:hypothetical protein